MASASTAIDTSNPRLLQERIEKGREEILRLQSEIEKYTDVAATITELPKKLHHHVMVPIGKRAMMPGKIVRSNEVLAHLGDEYFAWKTAGDAVDVITRKKKALTKQIKSEQDALAGLEEKKNEVDKFMDIKKLYEDEDIKDIQETEAESDRFPVTQATEEEIQEFFEIEEEERRLQESAAWDWDDVMKRMEELEALEERGEGEEETKEDSKPAPTVDERVAELKAKGNEAFGKRQFAESIDFYSQAITLDPVSHILYGNRSAAFYRLKKYEQALEDATRAVDLDSEWVKGHYRKASALAALKRFEDAAAAFDVAFKLCPTDTKLHDQAEEMRQEARKTQRKTVSFDLEEKAAVPVSTTTRPGPSAIRAPGFSSTPASGPPPAPPAVAMNTVGAKVFTGSIKERDEVEAPAPLAFNQPVGGGSAFRRSRFAGNPDADVVTLEPVGEAQPVKRVSRFRAQRSGAAQ